MSPPRAKRSASSGDPHAPRARTANRVFDTRFDTFKSPSTEGGPWGHESWSAQAKSAVTLKGTIGKSDDKDEGYVIEAFVPWKALSAAGDRAAPKAGDAWRMNVIALDGDSALSWRPVNGLAFHRAERWGHVAWADTPAPKAAADNSEGAGGAAAKPAAQLAKNDAAKSEPGKPAKLEPAKPAAVAPAASK